MARCASIGTVQFRRIRGVLIGVGAQRRVRRRGASTDAEEGGSCGIAQIYEGTNEIQRVVVAGALVKGELGRSG